MSKKKDTYVDVKLRYKCSEGAGMSIEHRINKGEDINEVAESIVRDFKRRLVIFLTDVLDS